MFERSVSKYRIYYVKYVGDGDSKTFNILSKTAPYPGIILFVLFQKFVALEAPSTILSF
jgi:hypothetical protein